MDRLEASIAMIDKVMEPCKHLRRHGDPEVTGVQYTCLGCGYKWFEAYKPLTEEQKADRASFEVAQSLGEID